MKWPTWIHVPGFDWIFGPSEPAKPDTSWTEHPFYEDRLGRVQRALETPETLEDARRRLVIVNTRRDTINERINRLRAAHQRFSHLLPEWRLLTAEQEALRAKLGEPL